MVLVKASTGPCCCFIVKLDLCNLIFDPSFIIFKDHRVHHDIVLDCAIYLALDIDEQKRL